MNARGSCAVREVQVQVSCCDVGFHWITNGNLENFMSVGVVCRCELVIDGIVKHIFDYATSTQRRRSTVRPGLKTRFVKPCAITNEYWWCGCDSV